MKICSCCGKELPLDNFSWKYKDKGIYQSRCKKCQAQADKRLYDNSPARREKIRERAKQDALKAKAFVKEYKQAHQCCKCGEDRWYLLDFHHINNNKEIELSKVRSWSIPKIQQEMAKCILLCANCHRDFHWQEANNGVIIEDYLK